MFAGNEMQRKLAMNKIVITKLLTQHQSSSKFKRETAESHKSFTTSDSNVLYESTNDVFITSVLQQQEFMCQPSLHPSFETPVKMQNRTFLSISLILMET
jgi:hypothetical protein